MVLPCPILPEVPGAGRVLPCSTIRVTWSRNGSPLSYYPRYLEKKWFSPILLPEVPRAGKALPCPTTRSTWSRMVFTYPATQGTWSRNGSSLSYYVRYLDQERFSPVLLPEVHGVGMVLPCPATRGTWRRKDAPPSYLPRYLE